MPESGAERLLDSARSKLEEARAQAGDALPFLYEAELCLKEALELAQENKTISVELERVRSLVEEEERRASGRVSGVAGQDVLPQERSDGAPAVVGEHMRCDSCGDDKMTVESGGRHLCLLCLSGNKAVASPPPARFAWNDSTAQASPGRISPTSCPEPADLSAADLRALDQSIADLTRRIEANPKDAEAYRSRGAAYGQKGDYDRAISDCTKAIELKPNMAEAYHSRGGAYGQKGGYDRAISDCTKAIELKPNMAEAYHSRGFAYGAIGRPDCAVADFTKAFEVQPNFAYAYLSCGVIYGHFGDSDRAIAMYTRAIELEPDWPLAYFNRAMVYSNRREMLLNGGGSSYDVHRVRADLDSAIADYTKVIELNPELLGGLPQ